MKKTYEDKDVNKNMYKFGGAHELCHVNLGPPGLRASSLGSSCL